ncbi:NAD-dependent DNA ligase LigA [Chitinophaga flava]|uniref:DNA ligase n=1 Tax=Chitinophaga flava TaxID=2259036 RepID=A0A365XVF0_9BACT|nr:NAD-dependent DNA ligase LigA [Chitinophaga flava]RBL90140.1 DNA ligase (NAD(+)) LigA [Chitinophaga flava]
MKQYNSKQAAALQSLSESLLAHYKKGRLLKDTKSTMDALYRVIPYHDWRYYIKSDPVLSDYEYDGLFAWLRQLEKEHPALAKSGSPVKKVAEGLGSALSAVKHKVPMLSLENTYNTQNLGDWITKTRQVTHHESAYCLEPKFDGTGISLIYENDRLLRGATRGDGAAGEDITGNIRNIASIPASAPFAALGIATIEIRGEVLMSKKSFASFNQERIAHQLPPMANPRNAAAGTLRMIHPEAAAQRKLEAVLYHVSYYTMKKGRPAPAALKTQAGTLDLLAKLGFGTPAAQKKVVTSIREAVRYCQSFEKKRDSLPYEIDGLVIKVNDATEQRLLGMTSHHPRWAVAYKFKPRQANSKLRKVIFSVGRMGAITPVAKIDPVAIGGVTVSSVSLFNEKLIKDKDIRVGDTVLVERAGDVIPYIVKPVTEMRKGTETNIRFPSKCPVCGHALEKPFGEQIWYCVNINCQAQVLERIVHFASKDAMDITGMGESHVREFYEQKLIKDIPSIFELNERKVAALERWGKRSASNLIGMIERARHQPLQRLIFGLGIHYVGLTTAKVLAKKVGYLPDLARKKPADLRGEGIGPKVAESISHFFADKENIRSLKKLERLGVNMHAAGHRAKADDTLKGKTFLFTGTLAGLTRGEAAEMVEQHGGQVLSSVSHALNYLVVGEHAGSKLTKASENKAIRLLQEKDFLKMVKPPARRLSGSRKIKIRLP